MERKYSIDNVCKELGLQKHQIRYMEKASGYKIERDEYNNRLYSDKDINSFKKILELKGEGLNFPQIKQYLKQKEISIEANDKEDEQINKELIEAYQRKLVDIVARRIGIMQDEIIYEIQNLKDEIEELKDENKELKQELAQNQERCITEIVSKFKQLLKEKEQNKPWYKKML